MWRISKQMVKRWFNNSPKQTGISISRLKHVKELYHKTKMKILVSKFNVIVILRENWKSIAKSLYKSQLIPFLPLYSVSRWWLFHGLVVLDIELYAWIFRSVAIYFPSLACLDSIACKRDLLDIRSGVCFILFCPIVAIVDFFRGQSFVTFRCYLHVTSQFDTSIIFQVLLVISLGSRADRHIANKVYRLPRPSPIASLSEFFPRPLRRLVWRIASAKTRDRI